MSFWSMAFLGSTTIGGPLGGWFAGARWGRVLGGLAAFVAAVFGGLSLRKMLPQTEASADQGK